MAFSASSKALRKEGYTGREEVPDNGKRNDTT